MQHPGPSTWEQQGLPSWWTRAYSPQQVEVCARRAYLSLGSMVPDKGRRLLGLAFTFNVRGNPDLQSQQCRVHFSPLPPSLIRMAFGLDDCFVYMLAHHLFKSNFRVLFFRLKRLTRSFLPEILCNVLSWHFHLVLFPP